jgi:RNA polymerase sigma-70 factor (ECF subfamily)
VRNLSISRYRAFHAQKRFSGAEVLLSELADCVPAPENVQRTVESGELGELISRWLEGLGAEDRALFIRRYWAGEAVKELAGELGQRPNAVTKRLLRLRESLRKSLEREGISV